MIDRLVVLGAGGDLATRHLLAALAHLVAGGALPPRLSIVGVDREPLTDQTYASLATSRLAEHAPTVDTTHRATLVRRLGYAQADLAAGPDLRTVVGSEPVVAYLALPPSAYAPAVEALRAGGIAVGSRIVVEKPFGEDLRTARELSRLLHSVFAEPDVYRVDHFLHHQSVQDLLALRVASPLFEPLWDREGIERVEITWEETAGVAGRADYYDRTGALRDMIQSHLLQLLALVAMESPPTLDAEELRQAKVTALQHVPAMTSHGVATRTARGRYTAGSVRGEPRCGYLDEPGVDPARGTETYAALQLGVDSPRWHGVPFVLRAGKALGRPRRHVRICFRAAPGSAISSQPAVLTLQMGPDRLALDVSASGRSGLPEVSPVRLEAERPGQATPASARLLRDVLAGDPTFAVRDDETEECWRITDSVLAGWRDGAPEMQDYAAGSPGPTRRHGLLGLGLGLGRQ